MRIETRLDGYALIIRLIEVDSEGRETVLSEDSVDVRDILRAAS